MILSRVIEHVKKQHWTAVFLDFVIVVIGVFIGIQTSNWNEARAEHRELENAVARLIEETKENLASIEELKGESMASLKAVGDAIDILQACDGSPGNRAIVETGLANAQTTRGMILKMSALKELTSAPYLLRQQTETQRKELSDAAFALNLFISESEWSENYPLEEHIEDSPNVSIGPMRSREITYHGFKLHNSQRELILAVPINVACKDESLIKTLYIWERLQSYIPRNIEHAQAELTKILELFSIG
jgi:hypothetical protein